MSTVAALIPDLPLDLVHLVLGYVPGVVLNVLSESERIEVVRRWTGLSLSDERTSLVLEERDVGNCDFDDLALAADEEAWCEALRAAYSFRALNELMRLGHITPPFLLQDHNDFVLRSLYEGGEQGLALARHLESRGPDVDILCRTVNVFVCLRHITHVPTVQYLLRRLLDANDVSFDVRRQQCLIDAPGYAQVFLGVAPSPLQLLVYHFYRVNFVKSADWLFFSKWSSLPWFEELKTLHPDACSLLLHVDLLHMVSGDFYNHATSSKNVWHIKDVLADARPPGMLTSARIAGTLSLTYGPYTLLLWRMDMYRMIRLYSWLADDWLAQAHQTNQWANFPDMFETLTLCDGNDNDAIKRLVEGLPDDEVVRQFTAQPVLLLKFFYQNLRVPRVLTELLPFDTWKRAIAHMPNKAVLSRSIYLRLFNVRQRAQLRRA
jgi:hypothetical protein